MLQSMSEHEENPDAADLELLIATIWAEETGMSLDDALRDVSSLSPLFHAWQRNSKPTL